MVDPPCQQQPSSPSIEGAVVLAQQLMACADPLEEQQSSMPASSSAAANGCANLWTFEDIQMLIGVDMPIFGCGKHPCVSLKLRSDQCQPAVSLCYLNLL